MQISDEPIKILCVEDEEFISDLYKRALVKEGYDVTVIREGQLVFDEVAKNIYDIMMLDIMIPGVLGVDILKRLRTEIPDLKTKIIITTNLEQSDEAKEGIEKQADGYLIKAEVTPKQMVEFIGHINLT